jgi:hypothetical protein
MEIKHIVDTVALFTVALFLKQFTFNTSKISCFATIIFYWCSKQLIQNVQWCSSIDEALRKAQLEQKPIFLEIVVGRLADKNSKVC